MIEQHGRIDTRDAVADGIPIRIYANAAERDACLTIFAHGGGFT